MPRGRQYIGYRDKNKSCLITECGVELTGRPSAVSLKHKLHLKNCQICELFDKKPINPNVFNDASLGIRKNSFYFNNEDRKNLTKLEEKKKQENSIEEVSFALIE